MKQKECRLCGYVWMPKVKYPKACPKCKTYNWEEKNAGEK